MDLMNLKKIRLERGLSVRKLSDASGIPIRTIEDIERRDDCMSSNLAKLAETLNVTLDELWYPAP